MKDKIVLFVIGVLVGAIISTGAFYVYTTTGKCNTSNQNIGQNSGQPPELPSGQNNTNGQPPEMPNNNNSQSNGAQDNN